MAKGKRIMSSMLLCGFLIGSFAYGDIANASKLAAANTTTGDPRLTTADGTEDALVDGTDDGSPLQLGHTTINESDANDGSITERQIIWLTKGSFDGDVSDGVKANHLPPGLSISVWRVSDIKLIISFEGKAEHHLDADDVDDVSFTIDKDRMFDSDTDLTTRPFKINFRDGQTLRSSKIASWLRSILSMFQLK